jgi:hypothetical protein
MSQFKDSLTAEWLWAFYALFVVAPPLIVGACLIKLAGLLCGKGKCKVYLTDKDGPVHIL